MRMLLVEDERIQLAVLARSLKALRPDWEVLTASDGAEAMGILRTRPVDLLATDIQMPGMDGMALLAQVRRDPALAHLPLIFITGQDDRASLRSGMNSGADDYLTKPFMPEELVQSIEARLRRRDQGEEAAEGPSALLGELQARLTGRELEILGLIGKGLVTKEIAAELGLSPRTVSVHRENLMRKLDLHNAAALAALAIRAELP